MEDAITSVSTTDKLLTSTHVDVIEVSRCSTTESRVPVRSSVQFSDFQSGLTNKNHFIDHCGAKCIEM